MGKTCSCKTTTRFYGDPHHTQALETPQEGVRSPQTGLQLHVAPEPAAQPSFPQTLERGF